MTTLSPHGYYAGDRLQATAVFVLFALVAFPAIFLDARFTEAYDETRYHLPAITHFAQSLPYPDLHNYSSATTPLYHLIFALLLKIGFGLTALRLINFAISTATVAAVFIYLRRAANPSSLSLANAGTLAFAASIYVVGPAVRLTTDNLALGCAVGVLYLVESERRSVFGLEVILATAAVLTRQLYLWLVPLLVFYSLTNPRWGRMSKIEGVAASIIPFLAVTPLFFLWGGFANARFAPTHELRGNIIDGRALVMAICMLAAYSIALAPAMLQLLSSVSRLRRTLMAGLFLAATAILPVFGARAGSYQIPMEGGWIRALAEHTPAIAGIWALFWILFPIGIVTVVALGLYAANSRGEIWILTAFGFWLILNVMQTRAMAKYYEPFEILVVARFAVRARAASWYALGVWTLAFGFIVVDIFRFWFGSGWASPGFAPVG